MYQTVEKLLSYHINKLLQRFEGEGIMFGEVWKSWLLGYREIYIRFIEGTAGKALLGRGSGEPKPGKHYTKAGVCFPRDLPLTG